MNFKPWIENLLSPILGLLVAGIVGTALLWVLGEQTHILSDALFDALFSGFELGHTLYYSTSFIFCGLAVAVCFRCGLFNIGAEGQLYMGALGILLSSLCFPYLPAIFAIPIAGCAAILFGGAWGFLAGVLKAKRGSHEVIVTILLNFISLILFNYLILYPLDDPSTQKPESLPIPESFQMPLLSQLGMPFFENTPVNISLVIAVFTAIGILFLLQKTPTGFEMRAVGFSIPASRIAGIKVENQILLAFFISGALAGMSALNDILGYHHRLLEGYSPAYGFTGIAVALMARNHPIGILFSGLLFGTLHSSARILEFNSDRITKELAFVIQSVLIAAVAAPAMSAWLWKLWKRSTPTIRPAKALGEKS